MADGNSNENSQRSKYENSQRSKYDQLADTISKYVKLIFVIAIFGVVTVWTFENSSEVDRFLSRILSSAEKLSIGGVLEVSLGKSGSGEDEVLKEWAAFVRVQDGLRLTKAHFGSQDGMEYIEVEALARTNLSGGYVGDSNELLYLADRGIELRQGETLRIYTYCGPKISPWLIAEGDRNRLWEGTCKTIFEQTEQIYRRVDEMKKVRRVKGTVPDVVQSIWDRPNDPPPGFCDGLFAEFVARKLYWRATGTAFAQPPKSVTQSFSGNDILKDDIQGGPDKDILRRALQVADDSENGKRGCYEDLYVKPSKVNKAVLARCIATDPEKGKGKEQIECLPMLPRFRGVFKASPGEGDRIVIMDRNKRILLDVDYWWSTKPGAEE